VTQKDDDPGGGALPVLRPGPDSHVLSLEVLWTPYALRGGWAGSKEPWSWLERLATRCEPGLLESVRDWRVMTPPDYEREFSLARPPAANR
jgi:hypothetical protein